jgi:PPOX class probable F420-dependent enzyme
VITRIVRTCDAYHRDTADTGRGGENTHTPVKCTRYGAAVVRLPESARALIESGSLAHCVTINPDGGPHVSAVWIGLDGDEIVMAHLPEHRKVRNLRRDPRVALSLDSDERNAIGMQHSLVIHGTATVTEGGAPELLQRLVKIYAGPDAEFPLPSDPPPGYVVRITVDRVGGVGPWTEH